MQELGVDLRKTLLIDHIPKYLCKKENILRHFEEAYESMDIVSVHFAYDVETLLEVDEELRKAKMANEYLQVFCYYAPTKRNILFTPMFSPLTVFRPVARRVLKKS